MTTKDAVSNLEDTIASLVEAVREEAQAAFLSKLGLAESKPRKKRKYTRRRKPVEATEMPASE